MYKASINLKLIDFIRLKYQGDMSSLLNVFIFFCMIVPLLKAKALSLSC